MGIERNKYIINTAGTHIIDPILYGEYVIDYSPASDITLILPPVLEPVITYTGTPGNQLISISNPPFEYDDVISNTTIPTNGSWLGLHAFYVHNARGFNSGNYINLMDLTSGSTFGYFGSISSVTGVNNQFEIRSNFTNSFGTPAAEKNTSSSWNVMLTNSDGDKYGVTYVSDNTGQYTSTIKKISAETSVLISDRYGYLDGISSPNIQIHPFDATGVTSGYGFITVNGVDARYTDHRPFVSTYGKYELKFQNDGIFVLQEYAKNTKRSINIINNYILKPTDNQNIFISTQNKSGINLN